MVIDFTATWCGPCRSMEPILKKLADQFITVEFVTIDVDEVPVYIYIYPFFMSSEFIEFKITLYRYKYIYIHVYFMWYITCIYVNENSKWLRNMGCRQCLLFYWWRTGTKWIKWWELGKRICRGRLRNTTSNHIIIFSYNFMWSTEAMRRRRIINKANL